MDRLRQSGSSKCLFPRGPSDAIEAVLLNTAGGVTGGDEFLFSASVGRGTCLTATTQACERAYKAQPGQTGKIRNRLQIGHGGRANWLPQETILFNGCSLDRRLSVEMDADATLLFVEPLVFGRAAMGEVLSDVFFRDRIEIRRAGVPLYLDALKLDGDANAHLKKPFIARGAGAMASLVYVAKDAAVHLAAVRAALPETGGASLIHDDTLVLRLIAQDSFELRRHLVPVVQRLNSGNLPRCWMI